MLASQALALRNSYDIMENSVFSHTCISYTIYSVNVTPRITLQEQLTVLHLTYLLILNK